MKTILCEKISRILKAKKQLEKILNLKIKNRGKEFFLTGAPEDEYIGEKTIDAINFGFSISKALLIKKEDYLFEILNIKNYTRRKDLKTIRARLIGKKGKTLQTLTQLTNSHLELKDNDVGIIAPAEDIKSIQEGIIGIIKGSKQSNVYTFLEKNKGKPIGDLGLKKK